MRPPVVAGKAVRTQCSHTIPQEAAFVNFRHWPSGESRAIRLWS